MATKACRTLWRPSSDTSVTVGDTVECRFQIGNCGDTRGPVSGYIAVNGTIVVNLEYTDLDPKELSRTIMGYFDMPNRTVKIQFVGKAYRDGAWRTDVDFSITLTPIYVPTTGSIRATSNPTGAWVYVDGTHKGTTSLTKPLTISNVAPGYRNVRFRKSGYQDKYVNVLVRAGEEVSADGILIQECTCTSWTNQECVGDGRRRQTRTCSPSGCESEEQIVSDATCRIVEPERTNTRLTCYDAETAVDLTVDLKAKLEEDTTFHQDIEDKYISFSVNGFAINALTDSYGIGKADYTPTTAGTFTITARFARDATYNPSTCTSTLTVKKAAEVVERAIRVTTFDVPQEGVKVLVIPYNHLLKFCDPFYELEETVRSSDPRLFEIGSAFKDFKYVCVEVKTLDDELVWEKKGIPLPAEGIIDVDAFGFYGCKYRSVVAASVTKQEVGKSVTLTASLYILGKAAGEGLKVDFYKGSDYGNEKDFTEPACVLIGSNTTDDKGKAVLSHAESELGTYEYRASYHDADTYGESRAMSKVEFVEAVEAEPGIFQELISFIMTTFDVDEKTARNYAYGGIGLAAIVMILTMMK